MAQKDIAALLVQSTEIRDETIDNANTELRVGTMLEDIIDSYPNSIDNPSSFSTLNDRDRAEQESTVVASATGAMVFDMSKSVSDITLTGNVSSIAFTNEPPSNKRLSALLNVYQDVTGGWTMEWTGSGVYAEDGKVAADFQPLATADSLTQYWLNWTGTYWVISLIKVSVTAL